MYTKNSGAKYSFSLGAKVNNLVKRPIGDLYSTADIKVKNECSEMKLICMTKILLRKIPAIKPCANDSN